MSNKIWIAGFCLAALIGGIGGIMGSLLSKHQETGTLGFDPEIGGAGGAGARVGEIAMMNRARFRVLRPVMPDMPDTLRLLQIREFGGGTEREQAFVMLYGKENLRGITRLSEFFARGGIEIIQATNLRTPETYKAFVERLLTLGEPGVSVETIAGQDVVLCDGEHKREAYFIADGVLYEVVGGQGVPMGTVRGIIASMAEQLPSSRVK